VSGAFEQLKQQVSRRIQQSQIGFSAEPVQVMDNELFQHVTTQDFVEYGFEPEFIGRLPFASFAKNSARTIFIRSQIFRGQFAAPVRTRLSCLRNRDQF